MQENTPNWLNNAAGYTLVATVFCMPLSVTILGPLYLLAVVFAVLNARQWRLQPHWWRHPVILAIGLYLLLYVVGMAYSVGGWHDRLKDFYKHFWILGTILLMPIFIEKKWRDYAINAFLAAMILTLILSYCKYFGLFSWRPDRGHSALFVSYIVQSELMAFAAILLLDRFLSEPRKRSYLLIIALLMIINIFILSEGRSGYITFCLLFCYLMYHRFHFQGLIPGLFVVISLCGLAYVFSSTLHARVNLVLMQTKDKHYLDSNTSIGKRYAQASNSWYLIKRAPWFGYGTGGIGVAYHSLPPERFQRAVEQDQVDIDYLNIFMKFGLVGLAAVFAFFLVLWYQATYLESRERFIARILILFFLLGAFANDVMSTIVTSHFLSLFLALTFAPLLSREKLPQNQIYPSIKSQNDGSYKSSPLNFLSR